MHKLWPSPTSWKGRRCVANCFWALPFAAGQFMSPRGVGAKVRLKFHAVRLSSSTRLLLLLLRLRFQVDPADAQVIESHLSPQVRQLLVVRPRGVV